MNKIVVAAVAALTLTAATPALAEGGAGSNRYDYLNGFRVLSPQELNSGGLFEGRNARVERDEQGQARADGDRRGSVTVENILDPTTTARGEYIRGGGGR